MCFIGVEGVLTKLLRCGRIFRVRLAFAGGI